MLEWKYLITPLGGISQSGIENIFSVGRGRMSFWNEQAIPEDGSIPLGIGMYRE